MTSSLPKLPYPGLLDLLYPASGTTAGFFSSFLPGHIVFPDSLRSPVFASGHFVMHECLSTFIGLKHKIYRGPPCLRVSLMDFQNVVNALNVPNRRTKERRFILFFLSHLTENGDACLYVTYIRLHDSHPQIRRLDKSEKIPLGAPRRN